MSPPRLIPSSGLVPDGPAFRAIAAEPWFALDPGRPVAGRWIEIRYRAGLRQDPVRPLLRVERPEGALFAILPGPVCGAARWVGRIPPDATALALSPVAAPGPFAFAVDGVRPIGRLALVVGALRRKPGLALATCWQRIRGRRVRARHRMAAIWASTPFGAYPAWARARSAAPRLPEEEPPPCRCGFLVEAEGAGEAALAATLRSIAAQTRPGLAWTLRGAADRDRALADAAARCDHVAVLQAGETLAPEALELCAAALARSPDLAVLTADEDVGGQMPVLKPGWSPRLQEATGYLDGFALVRTDGLRAGLGTGPLRPALIAAGLAGAGGRVGAVRRILLHRPAQAASPPVRRPAAPRSRPAPSEAPSVTAVVPNKDRLALLRTCVEGFRRGTAYPNRDLVVVDNGSADPATHAFYRDIAQDPAVTILERPGPFNFSFLTNEGVAAARGEAVLMLNNDIEVIAPDWLDRMVGELAPPDVAAVGAKLLYPGGRVQHAGVAIGLGGEAGHVYRGRRDRAGSWAGRLEAPHEVSAATGACLLVRRDRYEAVGGCDATLFPVSFNDIDLCLKLRREGWRVILAADAVLYHHESASRGPEVGAKQARAAREAAAFRERWRDVMRDDPYFHPGLSLMFFDVELG